MNVIREVLLHICVICSMCCIMAGILDYYNPYMDFGGHILFIRYILYGMVILLMLLENACRSHGMKRKKKIPIKI